MPSVPVARNYPPHPITASFQLVTGHLRSRVRSTRVEGGVNGRSPPSLVRPARQSWAETNLAALAGRRTHRAEHGQGRSAGPSRSARRCPPRRPTHRRRRREAGRPADEEPRAGVARGGDRRFDFRRRRAGVQGNHDFFLSTVTGWAQQENLIAIRPRGPRSTAATLTADAPARLHAVGVPAARPGVRGGICLLVPRRR